MILAKLKESTRDQHEALETVVDVLNKSFTHPDYRELLTKFYRFYSAIEPQLPVSELADAGFDIESRRKSPLLERDLEALGILDEVRKLPAWTDIPSTANAAEAFGSIYVMEGATLGGQVITRHLKEHLGLTPEKGGAFFNSYGPMVGPMWKEFGRIVTEFSEKNSGNDDTIVANAKETFECFRRCFEAEANLTASAATQREVV